MSKDAAEVLLDAMLYNRVSDRLNENHKTFFESIYRIDKSVFGVEGFNIIASIQWIAKREAKTRVVIIITENSGDYADCHKTPNIVIITPLDFLAKVSHAQELYDKGLITSLGDAILAELLLNHNSK
jgi:hypothetical protein